jgi:hypothetical protein
VERKRVKRRRRSRWSIEANLFVVGECKVETTTQWWFSHKQGKEFCGLFFGVMSIVSFAVLRSRGTVDENP